MFRSILAPGFAASVATRMTSSAAAACIEAEMDHAANTHHHARTGFFTELPLDLPMPQRYHGHCIRICGESDTPFAIPPRSVDDYLHQRASRSRGDVQKFVRNPRVKNRPMSS